MYHFSDNEAIEHDVNTVPNFGDFERVEIDGQWYVPERTCRMEYDTVHRDYVCTECGERYDSGTYTSVSDDDKYLLKPMRFCANCGARVVES